LLVKRARKYIVQSSTRLASTQISDQSTLTHSTDKRRRDSFLRHPPVSHIWNDVSSTSTVKDESNYVNDLVFTRDGKHVATGSNFEAVRVWDVTSKAAVCKFEAGFREKVSTVAISPDGKLIAAGQTTLRLWFGISQQGGCSTHSNHTMAG
jgi:WD40 repeat protein